MEILILVIVLVLVLGVGGFIAFSHRGGRATMEASPRPTVQRPPAAETPTGETGTATGTLEPPDVADIDVVVPPDLVEEVPTDLVEPEVVAPPATFRERLAKARNALSGYFGSILSRGVDAETWDEL